MEDLRMISNNVESPSCPTPGSLEPLYEESSEEQMGSDGMPLTHAETSLYHPSVLNGLPHVYTNMQNVIATSVTMPGTPSPYSSPLPREKLKNVDTIEEEPGEENPSQNCLANKAKPILVANSPKPPVKPSTLVSMESREFTPTNMTNHEPQLSATLDHPSIRNLYIIPDCQIQWVTVYQDKAEVCRSVRPRVSAGEVTEILFKKLSPYIDKDSIRVEVKGSATIQDVAFHTRRLDEEELDHQRAVNNLRSKLKREQRHYEALLVKRGRLEKQRAVLGTFADTLIGSDNSLSLNTSGQVDANTNSALSAPTPNVKHKDKGQSILQPVSENQNSNVSNIPPLNRYDPKHMETLRGFFSLYDDQAEKLDENLIELREEIEVTEESILDLERSLRELEMRHDESLGRELVVLIESTETGQVELMISYVVSNASWSPCYDIRVYNSDASLKIVYYGQITQATGEDWETSKLNLSTALPGVGGTVPDLGVQTIRYRTDKSVIISNLPPGSRSSMANKNKSNKAGAKNRASILLPSEPAPTTINSPSVGRSVSMRAQSMGPPSLGQQSTLGRSSVLFDGTAASNTLIHSPIITTEPTPLSSTRLSMSSNVPQALMLDPLSNGDYVDYSMSEITLNRLQMQRLDPMSPPAVPKFVPPENLNNPTTSTEYVVPRPPPVIPSDNQPHRVTIGIANMTPTFEFVSVPKKSPNAYVKATMQNTSKFAFISGPTNIYVDNNFIGKSTLGHVAPQEEFTCKLGVDPGIRMRYSPMYKYKEVSGSSGKNLVYTFRQVIEVKNEHEKPVRILVLDQLPTSGEDKIKVHLLEPVIKHPEKYDKSKPVRLNRSNTVEWDVDLQPGELKEIVLKYSVEHPSTEEVTFCEF